LGSKKKATPAPKKTVTHCPMLLAANMANGTVMSDTECVEHECAWWLDMVYSTENLRQQGRCAIKFMAEKTAEGTLPV
jgi:hypothetical protein